jgi:ribonuclease BN (tRNA processing enzyme)
MKLTFLGSGSAFTVGDNNYQSNMILENEQGQRLLIDCGTDARMALFELGLSYLDIDHVYISHLHTDHMGGLEWLALTRKFTDNIKPKLFISKYLTHDLWHKVLAGGLSTLNCVVATLSDFFEVVPVDNNEFFVWSGIEFRLVQTVHVMSGYAIAPSYGLLFNLDNQSVFITTDAQLAPRQILEIYNQADIIFQDCETSEKASGVHAHFNELKMLPKELKNKMWLYHYSTGPLPDAKKEGFRGFVKKGQCFNFLDPKTLTGCCS